MTSFTPLHSLVGGALIGTSAVMLMAFQGRIAGISGIVSRLLPPRADDDAAGRIAFLLGLILAPPLLIGLAGYPIAQTVSGNLPLMTVAGLLVGFGSVWGNGCTSGHGVCGIARLSKRSFAATAMFMATAAVTVFLARHLLGA
jgi:uncharacterized membrane protein YedE/YeeE